jgi:queuosine precursor transporter
VLTLPSLAHPAVRAALFVCLTLTVQAAGLLLLYLSQFGQNPFPRLPWAVLVFFGLLFSSPLLALTEGWSQRRRQAVLLATLLANAALALGLSLLAPEALRHLLIPVAAVGGALLLPALFGARASLAGAMLVYIVCTLLANYTFDSFLPLPFYGLVNVGTLFFGVTFTQRDRVHRYGRRWAYLMIFLAAALNVMTALSLGTPLRYVAVGFAAILLSETADTEVYQRFIHRSWWTRVASSNALSIPIDSTVFTVFAFLGEPFATPAWMLEVILTDILVKLAVGFAAAIRIGWRERSAGMAQGRPAP